MFANDSLLRLLSGKISRFQCLVEILISESTRGFSIRFLRRLALGESYPVIGGILRTELLAVVCSCLSNGKLLRDDGNIKGKNFEIKIDVEELNFSTIMHYFI